MARRRPLVRAAGKNQQIPVGDALVLAGALDEAPLVTLASAATVAIGAAQSNTINISGTATITAFDTIAAGARRTLRFSAALTLTYDASKLILPRAANITTVAGDVADFVSLGSGNWACIGYERATAAAEKADLNLSKGDVGLGNVDNTSDANKPVSSAAQNALNTKLNKSGDAVLGDFAVQNGNAQGTLKLGADVASTAITDNTRKLSRVTSPPHLLANPNWMLFAGDTADATNVLYIGGSPNASSGGANSIQLFTSNNQASGSHTLRWGVQPGGDFMPGADNTYLLGGASARIKQINAVIGTYSGPVRVGQYTLSTLPSASSNAGYEIDVTDAAGGPKRCRSDGTNWKILNTTTTVS